MAMDRWNQRCSSRCSTAFWCIMKPISRSTADRSRAQSRCSMRSTRWESKTAIVTNKLEGLADKLFRELGIRDRFAAFLGRDSLGEERGKPAPDLIHAMIARAGGGRAVFVGDSDFDIGAARAAAIPSVGVSFGFLQCPVEALGTSAVIDHFDGLIPALHRDLTLAPLRPQMPRQHQRRHAQPVGADVEGEARDFARRAAPAIAGGEAADQVSVGQLSAVPCLRDGGAI